MSVDPVKEFERTKSTFVSSRGLDAPVGKRHETSGQLLIAPGKGVPRTTWGDAFLFGTSFLQWADTPDFVHTKSYKRAKELWEKRHPLLLLTAQHGLGAGAVKLAEKINSGEIYPLNEEFWGYGAQFAIARGAAGVVPRKFDIAIESVKEAIKELPETLSAALDALPSLSPIADIIKWTSIGGGLFLLYWYVLRSKPKKTDASAG